MATQTTSMTTSEFAKAAGVPAASISKLIRDGKLKAKKTGGKWMIPQSQLESKAVRALKEPAAGAKRRTPAAKPGRTRPAPKANTAPPPQPPVTEALVSPEPEPAPEAVAPGPEAPFEEKTYTISEFAAMTYLTETGVAEWLKTGRIKGAQKENGEWRVLECNLQVPDIRRLLRK
jgi:excisionase family DNA binding protein